MMDDSEDSDNSDNCACPLRRSDSIRNALFEEPSAERIRSRIETIKDISSQFVEDINVIIEKCGSSHYVIMVLSEITIDLAKSMKGEKGRITVDIVKKHSKSEPDYKLVDSMHILHTILSRQLPPERIGGIINLNLATRPSSSTEDVEEALNYLYGSEPYSKIPNIPPLPPKNLAIKVENIDNAMVNGIILDKLKTIVDLRPQVYQNFSEMFEKFPHDNLVTQILYSFVTDLVENLHGDQTKIEASYIKEHAKSEENDTNLINAIESIFSTRLAEESYFGLINLMEAFSSHTSVHDIEKALEYLYGSKDDDT